MKCKHLDDGYCLKLSDDTVMQPCIEGPCPFDGAPTNADRIRAMSDEELAEFIPNWSYTKACKCDEQRFVDCNNECERCVADWLQQPAPEEGEQA